MIGGGAALLGGPTGAESHRGAWRENLREQVGRGRGLTARPFSSGLPAWEQRRSVAFPGSSLRSQLAPAPITVALGQLLEHLELGQGPRWGKGSS